MTVDLGPVFPPSPSPKLSQNGSGLAYNPCCLKRDISSWVSSNWTKDSDSYSLITQSADISSFQTTMQGDFATGFHGVHAGGPLHHRWRPFRFPRRPDVLPTPQPD
jgi:tyrosinase